MDFYLILDNTASSAINLRGIYDNMGVTDRHG